VLNKALMTVNTSNLHAMRLPNTTTLSAVTVGYFSAIFNYIHLPNTTIRNEQITCIHVITSKIYVVVNQLLLHWLNQLPR
jgi:hypothetical protein